LNASIAQSPFKIVYGFVGQVTASVPWRKLAHDSISIELFDVYLIVVPTQPEGISYLMYMELIH